MPAEDAAPADQPADQLADLVPDVASLRDRLAAVGYLAGEGLATALFCGVRLPQPILLEGEAGVGKTQAARSLAEALGTRLIRLQCYEGIDVAEAVYEWNYPRQLLGIRLAEAQGAEVRTDDLFARDYLMERPLLQALEHPGPLPAVLLVDEVDRADEDFEAFCFELLGEGSLTVPEIGTLTAVHPPIAVLTSNRTRDLHDALKRRCLYHWIDYPDLAQVVEIVRSRVPAAAEPLTRQAAAAVQRLRALDLQKPPGVAEVIDWVQALELLGVAALDEDTSGQTLESALGSTLGSVLKYREDRDLAWQQRTAWAAGG